MKKLILLALTNLVMFGVWAQDEEEPEMKTLISKTDVYF